MGGLALLLSGFLGLGVTAAQQLWGNQGNEGKLKITPSPVPSLVDPNVWPAGSAASRHAGQSSGQPLGLRWQSAANFMMRMPGLIGR